MNLFILRHGEAEPISSSDRQRELTVRGRQQIVSMVERNKNKLANVQMVFASPFVRTQQTAQVFIETLQALTGKQFQIHTEDRLTPDRSPQEVLELLCKQDANANIILISHQPLVSELVSSFCERDAHSLSMPPATLASITLDPVGMGFGQLNFID